MRRLPFLGQPLYPTLLSVVDALTLASQSLQQRRLVVQQQEPMAEGRIRRGSEVLLSRLVSEVVCAGKRYRDGVVVR